MIDKGAILIGQRKGLIKFDRIDLLARASPKPVPSLGGLN
jgi:hypothetical protein